VYQRGVTVDDRELGQLIPECIDFLILQIGRIRREMHVIPNLCRKPSRRGHT
jgi:hypothetical protein